jgi:hypothetical protein
MPEKPQISKTPTPIDGTSPLDSDWPTLIERLFDDVSRILRSEANLLRTSVAAALELQISKAVMQLTIVGMLICGALCLLGAAILLLHRWLPLWQAFALVGLALLVAALVIKAATRPHPTAQT